jgi:hypothetical protein
MKYALSIIMVFMVQVSLAQPDQGALKTRDGILLFFNADANAFTLNLPGDADISQYPFIKLNNDWFQFFIADQSEFGSDDSEALNSFMKWELDFHSKELDAEIKYKSEPLLRKGVNMNFWKFSYPDLDLPAGVTAVKSNYFLDVVNKNKLLRFNYASASGDDAEARLILFRLSEGLQFYRERIDLSKLQQALMSGDDHYKE